MIMQWNRVKADELAVVIAMDGDALIEWMEQDRPAVDVDKAWARTDLGVLAQLDVYPSIWDRQDEAETNIAYLRDGYAELRDTFQSARAANDAMIISLM